MRLRYTLIALVVLIAAAGSSLLSDRDSAHDMTSAAVEFLGALSEEEMAITVLEFESEQRVDWHFIPKKHRKGIQIRDMDSRQRQLAYRLLRSALSQMGYDKSLRVMELESLLHEQEKTRNGRFARDALRYYVTVFGSPSESGRWGLSVEGHHLSLNFVVHEGQVVSSTPQFLGANPAVIDKDYGDEFARGTRVLATEEIVAFDLLRSLNAEQRQLAVIAEQAPREIRAAGDPQPPLDSPQGLTVAQMTAEQVSFMRTLVEEYLRAMPGDVAQVRREAIDNAGWGKIHFAWAGANKPGIGHYYRIQGPTFLIEFVNTQPDAEGNPANHIHCVWRDAAGDFGIPLR